MTAIYIQSFVNAAHSINWDRSSDMVLWWVLSSQVMIDYREVSHILLQEAKYLVLKKFETIAFLIVLHIR